MRWSIRNQILVPFAAVLLVAVGTISFASSWLAVRRSERTTLARLESVLQTLESATFPFSDRVLEQMHGLSEAHFAVVDRAGQLTACTLAISPETARQLAAVPVAADLSSLARHPLITIGGEPYFAVRLPVQRPGQAAWLVVLYSVRSWRAAQWSAAWPPLAVGAGTLAVMAALAAAIAARIGRRIGAVQQLFARLAEGQFEHVPVTKPRDELADLIASANRLSDQLKQLQDTIRRTEQVRVLAQIAGGLAHQLRNDITGARMAVELHRRRCASRQGEDSIEIALRQLQLTEEHVRSFLAFARRDPGTQAKPGDLQRVLADVKELLEPTCEHTGVRLVMNVDLADQAAVPDAEGVRVAVMNLVLNGIEAAGAGGQVELRAVYEGDMIQIEVADTGPGPRAEVRSRLFEPFVSTKPHGVGLGLAIARRVAEELGGQLTWHRHEGRTVFKLCWPVRG